MMRSFFMVLTASVCGAVCAADGTWKDGSAGGRWSDASNWVDGILPSEGGIANLSFTKGSLNIDATGVTATLGGIDFRNTLDANQQVTLENGAFTLKPEEYEVSGDALTQVGSLAETKQYSVVVTAKTGGNYTGSVQMSWKKILV